MDVERDSANINISLKEPFVIGKLELAIKEIKWNKSPGIDILI